MKSERLAPPKWMQVARQIAVALAILVVGSVIIAFSWMIAYLEEWNTLHD